MFGSLGIFRYHTATPPVPFHIANLHPHELISLPFTCCLTAPHIKFGGTPQEEINAPTQPLSTIEIKVKEQRKRQSIASPKPPSDLNLVLSALPTFDSSPPEPNKSLCVRPWHCAADHHTVNVAVITMMYFNILKAEDQSSHCYDIISAAPMITSDGVATGSTTFGVLMVEGGVLSMNERHMDSGFKIKDL